MLASLPHLSFRIFAVAAASLLIAVACLAQQRALTADDYARAEKPMGYNTNPLVLRAGVRATWLPGERFYNNTRTAVIMRGKKILALIIALALLLACIVALRLRRDKPIGPSVSETSRLIGGPAFEVQVEMPAFNSGRAPWEIPRVILGYDHGPRFNQASPGAQVGKIAADHIELSADGGWDILIETDGEGRLTQGTYVAFPVKLGGRPLKFNCRPADLTVGYLHTTARTGSDELEGSFQLEVAICENAASGKTAAWPYQPLKVRGNFAGLKKQGER